MNHNVLEFIRRGLIACGFGPMVLVVLYLLFQKHHGLEMLTVSEVCIGIVSLSTLAFVAGGMNIVYQIEQLPLMLAILIHGGVLYVSYLVTYLVNGWLEWGAAPLLFFTAIFVICYLIIWIIIYAITRRNTAAVNAMLKQKQQNSRKPLQEIKP